MKAIVHTDENSVASVSTNAESIWLAIGIDEDAEARGGHQPADVAVLPAPPGDQAARRERDAHAPEDHLRAGDRRLLIEDRRHQRDEAEDGRGRPQRRPEPGAVSRRREAPQDLAPLRAGGVATSPLATTSEGAMRIISLDPSRL